MSKGDFFFLLTTSVGTTVILLLCGLRFFRGLLGALSGLFSEGADMASKLARVINGTTVKMAEMVIDRSDMRYEMTRDRMFDGFGELRSLVRERTARPRRRLPLPGGSLYARKGA